MKSQLYGGNAPRDFWPKIDDSEVREMEIARMIFDLADLDLAGFEDTVKEFIEKHRQLKHGDITLEEFNEHWEEVKMIRKLLRSY